MLGRSPSWRKCWPERVYLGCARCRRRAVDATGSFEQQQGLPHRADVVNAQNLHALPGQRRRHADGPGQAIGLFVAQHLADKSLARMADQQRAAQRVQLVAMGQQRQVVLVRFAKADARIERDFPPVDAGRYPGRRAVAAR